MRNQKLGLVIPILIALSTTGCAGPPGPEGPPGVVEYEVVVGETAVNTTPAKQLQVDCPEGKKALGAGWSVLGPDGCDSGWTGDVLSACFRWLTLVGERTEPKHLCAGLETSGEGHLCESQQLIV